MERRLSRSGRTSGSRRCSYRAGVGIGAQADDSVPDFSTEAYYHHRKHQKDLKMCMGSTSSDGSTTEEDSFSCGLHEGLSKKDEGTPREHVGEALRVGEKRYSSPSVIAKLMGLDDLPPVVSTSENIDGSYLFKKSFAGIGDKCEYHGDQQFYVSRRERHKVKNVHELFKSSKNRNHSDQVLQEKTSSKPDLARVRKQSLETKHLSTYESLQNSKKFNEVLDILQANKDIFLEFLENSNPLFPKNHYDLEISEVSAYTSNIASLRNGKLHDKNELFDGSEGETLGCTQKPKDNAHCCTKLNASLINDGINDHMNSVLHKLLRPHSAKKADDSSRPTSIVVLKPNVQQAQNGMRIESFPSSLVNNQPSFRGHKEFRQEASCEQGKQGKLLHPKTIEYKAEGAREIPKNVSLQIKQSSRCHSEEVQASKINGKDSLLTYLREPSLNMKARKHLTERWKMNRSSTEGSAGEVKITLAEMLSLSDTEPLGSVHQFTFHNVPEEKAIKEGITDSWAQPYGISNRDSWKEKFDSRLPRYENVRTPSGIYGTSKPARNQVDFIKLNDDSCMLKDVLNVEQNDLLESKFKRKHSLASNFKHCDNNHQFFRSCGEENKSPVKDFEMYHGEQKNGLNPSDFVESKPLCSRFLKKNVDNIVHTVHSSSNPKGLSTNFIAMSDLKEFQQILKHEDHLGNFLENEANKVQLAALNSPLKEASMDTRQSIMPIKPNDAERLSPDSVLEPPSEDGKSTPGCFERIRADLHDLRRQLYLLELEPLDSSDDKTTKRLTLGDKSNCKILDKLKDRTERDFSYLLDVLTISGIYTAEEGELYDACCSLSNPVFPDVFDKLERKYDTIDSWSRSERKLLFDHINSILSEVLAPCVDLHPWVRPKRTTSCGRERLVHKSWRILAQQQKELSRGKPEDKVLDTRWLFLDDDVDMMGREIERMLKDDLLDELLSELSLG
ncbi:hypothetical protein HPP92_019812 [Vanilla planifolia]|uniref:DUF4378 domain-containing protein n=1 Tax=Vanilla planifolia TaxID=51239 RepID=A0A835Q769_VANPL|nr:hypothetical protein HPP92_019812 [Vanilla planifolia]